MRKDTNQDVNSTHSGDGPERNNPIRQSRLKQDDNYKVEAKETEQGNSDDDGVLEWSEEEDSDEDGEVTDLKQLALEVNQLDS